jgi:hypothetical protein
MVSSTWRDLATGLGLKMVGRATMTGMFGAQQGVLNMDMTNVVDWEKRRL